MSPAIDIQIDESGRQFVTLNLHGMPSGRVVINDFDITNDVLDFSGIPISPHQIQSASHTENGVAGVLIRFDFDGDGVFQGDELGHAELFLAGISLDQLESYQSNQAAYGTKQYQFPESNTVSDSPTLSFFYDNVVAPADYLTSSYINVASSEGFQYQSVLGGSVHVEGRDLILLGRSDH